LQHSGRKNLMERANLERHYLVEICNSMGLISDKHVTELISGATELTGQETVRGWLEQESRIRTGMMIWVAFQSLPFPNVC
jgi:hypothetical protein